MVDRRFVYGANCAWFGPISAIGKRGNLPCCPYCGGMLFEYETEQLWWDRVDRYTLSGHPEYRTMIEWAADKHFASSTELEAAFKEREV